MLSRLQVVRRVVWVALAVLGGESMQAAEQTIWLGTSGHPRSEGIYRTALDTQSGQLSESELAAEIVGPGFLAMHPSGNVLYAAGKLQDVDSIVAYRIEGERLSLLNSLPTQDGQATHLAVNDDATLLVSAQYGAGSTCSYRLAADGSLAEHTGVYKHRGGSGVVANRQAAPHAHWSGFSPDGKYVFVPDLGLDAVVIYRVDASGVALEQHGQAAVPPGGGPRHMKFHPNGKWAFVLNELSLSISCFAYDAETGTLNLLHTVATIPADEAAKESFNSCSEIRVHPNGRWLYAATRGHDTISVFAIDDEAKLTPLQIEPVRGATPRNFNLDPKGQWLVVGGQDSHTLASFAVDQQTGKLTYNRSIINTPAPICVLFEHE